MPDQPKIRRLKNLKASEVSLVSRGAIRRPFLVIKNEDGTMPANDAILPMPTAEQEAAIDAVIAKRAQTVPKAVDAATAKRALAIHKATDATSAASMNEVDADATTVDPAAQEALDERSMAALKAVYRILLPFKGKLSEADVDDVLAELDLDDTGEDGQDDASDADVDDADDIEQEDDQDMAKDADFQSDKFEKAAADWSPSKPDGASDDDHSKAMQAAKDAYAKCIGKAADSDDEDEEDENDVKKSAVSKAALPAHAELVAKAEAEKKEWIAKAADLEARLGRMESERILKSHEDSVRKDCQVLGKDPAAQARIIKSQYDASKEAGDAYVELLRESAKLTHQSGIFKSVGTSSNAGYGAYVPSEGQGSPRQQLEAMVKGLVQKGESKDESAAWATVLNTQRGQELYAAGHGSSH